MECGIAGALQNIGFVFPIGQTKVQARQSNLEAREIVRLVATVLRCNYLILVRDRVIARCTGEPSNETVRYLSIIRTELYRYAALTHRYVKR